MNTRRSLPLFALAATVLGGCAMMPGATTTEPVFVLDEQSRGDMLDIASVTLVAPGYVVVHDDVNGQPGPVLGHSELLDPGIHENLVIALDGASTGAGVWPMLHTDDGNGSYEFPGPDAPTVLDGVPVMTSLTWN